MWTENLITNAPLERCPLRTILLADPDKSREVNTYRLEVYPLWQKNHLLHPGSAGEQPARELAFMREFDAVNEKVQAKYEEIIAEKADGEQ